MPDDETLPSHVSSAAADAAAHIADGLAQDTSRLQDALAQADVHSQVSGLSSAGQTQVQGQMHDYDVSMGDVGHVIEAAQAADAHVQDLAHDPNASATDLAHAMDAAQSADAQVQSALHDMNASAAEAIHAIDDAKIADEHVTQAEALQHEQAVAADSGDFANARDLAQHAEYELKAAEEHGRDVDHQIIQAQHDEEALTQADWQQQMAHAHAVAADSYAQSGDYDHAATAAEHADDDAATSSDYGHQGDHGGAHGSSDHSADGDDGSTSN
jgi:hypothetical protein